MALSATYLLRSRSVIRFANFHMPLSKGHTICFNNGIEELQQIIQSGRAASQCTTNVEEVTDTIKVQVGLVQSPSYVTLSTFVH